jgi:UDP-3-O-[3-hydroxymyristoyl] glucosamine N-acyltransferase
MSEARSYTARALAEVCGGRLANPAGQGETEIRRPATLDEAGPDAITWIADERYAKSLAACEAAAIIGTEALLAGEPRGIIVDDPELAMAKVLDCFSVPHERPAPGIHPSAIVHEAAVLGEGAAVGALAVVHSDVRIGPGTIIHEGVSLGRGVRIGQDCEIHDRCVIYDRCELGDRVILHAGVVIGADGFGYIFRDGRHRKLPHLGTVVIEDDVEVGANACIDRAKLGVTRIGRGSKIDNLVMSAHNVRTGPVCVLVAQVGLAGSVRLGTGVVLGGQAGITEGVDVGDGVWAGAKSMVDKDTAPGKVLLGVPARERMAALRDQARIQKLPKLLKQVAELERRVARLDAAADNREDG